MDWKSLIAELQGFGLTQAQVAAICGCGQGTLSDLANGHTKEPRFSLGKALEELVTRCRAGDVPGRGDAANEAQTIVSPAYTGPERRKAGA